MPLMPIHNSGRNINANKAAPLRDEAAKTFQADQQIVGAISDVTQKWSDAHDVMQFSEAKGKYEVEVARIQANAAQDPNFKDSKKYYKELEDAKNNSLVGISNKQVTEKLAMDMDFGNQVASIKIDSNFKQKEIIANKFNVAQSIEGLQQKKLQATTAGEAAQVDQDIQELLALNVGSGVLTDAEAETIKDDANLLSAEYASTVTPDQFIANGAKHYGIPEDKYQKLKETARLSKERGEAEAIKMQDEIQEQTETDLIIELADKKIDRLSVPEITKKMISGEISTEFGEAYIKVLTSPKHIAAGKKNQKKYAPFSKYASELFKAEDPKDVRAAIVKMLDGAAEGELDQEELGLLIKAADKAGQKKGLIGKLVDSLGNIALGGKYSEQRMAISMFKAIIAGKPPEEAKKEAVDMEQIKSNPDRTKYLIGDAVDTPQGTMYVWGYYDDGDPDVRKEKPKQ